MGSLAGKSPANTYKSLLNRPDRRGPARPIGSGEA